MKNMPLYYKFILLGFFSLVFSESYGKNQQTHEMQNGKWTISFNEESKMSDFIKDGEVILKDIFVKTTIRNIDINTTDYSTFTYSSSNITDEMGDAVKYVIEYTKDELPTIQQVFYLYPDADYFLTEVILLSTDGVNLRSNYIAPIYSDAENHFLPRNVNNRMMIMPFDNDGFVTYGAYALNIDTLSFEVTSIFDGDTQAGLVLGSVEHDTWKSAIRMSASDYQYINKLECFNGVTHHATRDNAPIPGKVIDEDGNEVDGEVDCIVPHGLVYSLEIHSSRVMVGFFDDWRTGLETFGEVNAAIAPPRVWNSGVPFGWNSWGGMERGVNYDGVISVSDFMKELQDKGFSNDDVLYIGLDSYWDNMSWEQLQRFADHCYANGQIPGIYWTPFSYWGQSDPIERSTYSYSSTWLTKNGIKRAGHMDPTHPGTLARIDYFTKRFKELGFQYIKLDFLNHGSREADSFYARPEGVTTGIQAYNYGMDYFVKAWGDERFITLSISPVFPAHHAQARRISCDAWGEMWHTQYMMNSFSFGWWLNRVYTYLDADHLVFGAPYSEGENRARLASAAVTGGLFMFGDNLSTAGTHPGNPNSLAWERTEKYALNTYVTDILRNGQPFRPAYGHRNNLSDDGATDLFYLDTKDHFYIAYFSYQSGSKTGYLDLSEFGIDPSTITGGIECLQKTSIIMQDGKLRYSVPAKDARIYRLDKLPSTSIKDPEHVKNGLTVNYDPDANKFYVDSPATFTEVKVTSINGMTLYNTTMSETKQCEIPGDRLSAGVYIVTVAGKASGKMNAKFIR